MCHTLYNSMVWGTLVWTVLLYIKLCILCTLPIWSSSVPISVWCWVEQIQVLLEGLSWVLQMLFINQVCYYLKVQTSWCLGHCCIICLSIRNQYGMWDSGRMVRSTGICNVCCLLLSGFRLLRHILDSRIYHRGFGVCKNQKIKKSKSIQNLILILPLWLWWTATIHFWWWLDEECHR